MKNEKVKNIFKKIHELRKTIYQKREEWLSKEIEHFKEEYFMAYHRQPESFEISRFRKDKVMKLALKVYLVVFVIGLIIWTILSGGGGV